jgi:hypothetical protein
MFCVHRTPAREASFVRLKQLPGVWRVSVLLLLPLPLQSVKGLSIQALLRSAGLVSGQGRR